MMTPLMWKKLDATEANRPLGTKDNIGRHRKLQEAPEASYSPKLYNNLQNMVRVEFHRKPS